MKRRRISSSSSCSKPLTVLDADVIAQILSFTRLEFIIDVIPLVCKKFHGEWNLYLEKWPLHLHISQVVKFFRIRVPCLNLLKRLTVTKAFPPISVKTWKRFRKYGPSLIQLSRDRNLQLILDKFDFETKQKVLHNSIQNQEELVDFLYHDASSSWFRFKIVVLNIPKSLPNEQIPDFLSLVFPSSFMKNHTEKDCVLIVWAEPDQADVVWPILLKNGEYGGIKHNSIFAEWQKEIIKDNPLYSKTGIARHFIYNNPEPSFYTYLPGYVDVNQDIEGMGVRTYTMTEEAFLFKRGSITRYRPQGRVKKKKKGDTKKRKAFRNIIQEPPEPLPDQKPSAFDKLVHNIFPKAIPGICIGLGYSNQKNFNVKNQNPLVHNAVEGWFYVF